MSFTRPDIEEFAREIESSTLNAKIKKSWKNFCGTVDLPEALVIDIDDKDSLKEVVKRIHQRNMKVENPQDRIVARCVAGGLNNEYDDSYSLTDLAKGNVLLRYTGKKKIKIVDADKNIVKVSGFFQLGELNKLLYEEYGLVLPTASLIPYVTVAGLAATAGHGTGRDQPAFTGLIKAITFCRPDGELITIREFKEDGEPNPDFEIIRSGHLGLFGVVVDVELQCMPRKKLECVVQARSLPAFEKKCDKGLFTDEKSEYPYVEVIYMPTYGKDGEHDDLKNNDKKNVQIRKMKEVPISDDDQNISPWDHIIQEIEMKLEGAFHLADLLRLAPELTPFFMDYFATRGEIGDKDTVIVGPWHEVWHYLTSYPRDIVDLDVLIPISKDGHEIHDIIELMNQKLKEYADRGVFPINLGIYLRYFKGTKGAMSTSSVNEDQHVLGLDFVALKGTPGADEFIKEMASILTSQPYNGKPHWGKNLPDNVDYKRLYPEMPKYKEVLENWYEAFDGKLERSAFLNDTCCDIMQLPEKYYPAPIQNVAEENQQDDVSSSVPIHQSKTRMAAKLMHLLPGENESAKSLRYALDQMANPKRFDSKSNLFKGSVSVSESEMARREERAEEIYGDVGGVRGPCGCTLY